MRSRRLYRSSKDKILFGVAGGLAQYFNLDPVLMRLIVLLIIFATGGMAILLYLVLAIVMPKEETSATEPKEVLRENMRSIASETAEAGRRVGEAFQAELLLPRPTRSRPRTHRGKLRPGIPWHGCWSLSGSYCSS